MAETETTAYAKVVAKAWSDPAFKANLLADPAGTLNSVGVAMPAGVTVKVVEDTEKLVHFVLPARLAEGELSDESLKRVAAGANPYGGVAVGRYDTGSLKPVDDDITIG